MVRLRVLLAMRRLLLLAVVAVGTVASVGLVAQARVPLASQADKVLSPLEISVDGSTFTFRGVAADRLQVCVEPRIGLFGPRRCYSVQDMRAGLVLAGKR